MVVRRSIAVPLERVQEALMLLICPVAGLCFRWAVTFFLELRQFNMELFNLDTRRQERRREIRRAHMSAMEPSGEGARELTTITHARTHIQAGQGN